MARPAAIGIPGRPDHSVHAAERLVIGLRIKLVTYFLVLSLLPLAGGYWAFSSSLAGNEQRRVDARLTAELRAAAAAYRERAGAVRTSLRRGDRAALERSLRTLSRRAGLTGGDRLLLVAGSRVAAGAERGARLAAPPGGSQTLELEGVTVRSAGARVSGARDAVMLAVVTPQVAIESATASARRRLLVGVLATLLLIALVAYFAGLAIARTVSRFVGAAQAIARGRLDERVRVRTRDEFGQLGAAFNEMADQLEAQRRRLQLATLRFGEALAATHDIDQLLRVIVTTAVESTRAAGGTIRSESGEVARAGTPLEAGEKISVPLEVAGESFGTLVLSGVHFDPDDQEIVAPLAAHAVTALENARLHQIVKRQALLDSLTGMPNRRQCESALATELSQHQRFGAPLTFVLADLDEFKAVNDRYGHPVGDRVLREFSDILRELVRDADVAARWGGEEFALVLPNTDEKGAAVLVERIRSTLEHRAIIVDRHLLSITASFGVAVFPHEPSAARLIAAADEALYVAKRSGRNRVETAPRLPLSA